MKFWLKLELITILGFKNAICFDIWISINEIQNHNFEGIHWLLLKLDKYTMKKIIENYTMALPYFHTIFLVHFIVLGFLVYLSLIYIQ